MVFIRFLAFFGILGLVLFQTFSECAAANRMIKKRMMTASEDVTTRMLVKRTFCFSCTSNDQCRPTEECGLRECCQLKTSQVEITTTTSTSTSISTSTLPPSSSPPSSSPPSSSPPSSSPPSNPPPSTPSVVNPSYIYDVYPEPVVYY
jgi:hypothetical protein